RHSIALLPPDINRSKALFGAEEQGEGKNAIRYALAAIKGVGDGAMRALVAARETKGPFKDLFDLAERVDVRVINRKQMEGLAMAGAFDSLNRNRAQVVAAIDMVLKHGHAASDERNSGQANIFGALDTVRPALPKAKAWDDLTRLQHEFQALGFYLSAHPLDTYGALLERLNVVSAGSVGNRLNPMGASRFKLAGIVLSKQERTAKSGNRFAFVQASDTGGAFEVTVFSELLAAKRDVMEAGQAVLFEVDAQAPQSGGQGASGGNGPSGDGEVRFIARNIEPLADVAARSARGLRVKLYDAEVVSEVQKQLADAPKGKGKITLSLELDEAVAEVDLPGGWHLSEQLKTGLRQLGNGLEVQEW
ncbi:MAG: DNA polymerase III subunit alpha, partial [Alphaproteobacteria bacterium]|nr:DNA polymerase III subunit alpha [Alphaproteobacteria bacterium]